MAVIAGAIAALGTIVSAYAAYQSGQQQAKALDYQAKVARNQATAAQQAAQVAAENARERNRRVLASQRARIGASGVIGSEGSSLLVQRESAEQAALEEARIRYGGEVQATGLESAERLRRFEAGASRRAGAPRGGGGPPPGGRRGGWRGGGRGERAGGPGPPAGRRVAGPHRGDPAPGVRQERGGQRRRLVRAGGQDRARRPGARRARSRPLPVRGRPADPGHGGHDDAGASVRRCPGARHAPTGGAPRGPRDRRAPEGEHALSGARRGAPALDPRRPRPAGGADGDRRSGGLPPASGRGLRGDRREPLPHRGGESQHAPHLPRPAPRRAGDPAPGDGPGELSRTPGGIRGARAGSREAERPDRAGRAPY